MYAGSLRHHVTINQMVLGAADAYGERAPTPTLFAVRWASIEPMTGRESEHARQIAATASHKITIRYVAGLLPTMQIVYGTRTFFINAIIDPEERRRELVLYCTEKVSG